MYMERKLGNNKTLKNFHINVNGKIVKKYKEGPSASYNGLVMSAKG